MKQHFFAFKPVIILLLALFFNCCSTEDRGVMEYNAESYIPAGKLDSLLTDIVTYIGPKPKYTDHITRHEARYRDFYSSLSEKYHIHSWYKDKDGNNYFFIIRPAKHSLYDERAVYGRLRLDEEYKITVFEELFVTRPMHRKELESASVELFPAALTSLSDLGPELMQFIEWPDERCMYDKEKHEWRYDVAETNIRD